jgi:hypothetical protein
VHSSIVSEANKRAFRSEFRVYAAMGGKYHEPSRNDRGTELQTEAMHECVNSSLPARSGNIL